jgi:uncharacterized membrane protein
MIIPNPKQRDTLIGKKEEKFVIASTKNKIGLSIILMAIICFISLPGLTLTASAQPVNSQTAHNPFNSIVKDPDFSVYASPSYLSTTAGLTVNTTVLVTPRYSFNDTVSLSAVVPDGWTATFTLDSLSITNGYYGYYFYGFYNWSTLSVAVPSDTAAGKYTIAVTGTNGSLMHSVNVTVNVVAPDFRIYAFPYLSATAGSTANSTIMVTSLYEFNGTVSLSATVPDGWAATFTPPSLSITNGYYSYYGYYSYGNYNWSALSVTVPSDAATGKYTIVVTGSSGSLAHSMNVTVNVVAPDFKIYAYPSYLWATADSTANSTIILKSLYGFSGTVSLSASVPDGWSASFVSSSLSLANAYYGYHSYGSYNWSTLSIAVPSDTATGKYTVVVTATSGSLTCTVNVTVNVVVPDFRIYAFPYLSATAGSTANSTIILMSRYGFSGTVSLDASVPDGWSATFVPSSLSVTAGYFNCSALSVVVPAGTAAGKYTIVVTGTSGSVAHSANVTVNVGGSDFWGMP